VHQKSKIRAPRSRPRADLDVMRASIDSPMRARARSVSIDRRAVRSRSCPHRRKRRGGSAVVMLHAGSKEFFGARISSL
jgi:hypothetical protein